VSSRQKNRETDLARVFMAYFITMWIVAMQL